MFVASIGCLFATIISRADPYMPIVFRFINSAEGEARRLKHSDKQRVLQGISAFFSTSLLVTMLLIVKNKADDPNSGLISPGLQ